LNELESYINSLENNQSPKLQEFKEHFKLVVLPTLFEQQKKLEIATRRMKRLAAIGINKKNILQDMTQRERRRPTIHDGMIDVDAIDVCYSTKHEGFLSFTHTHTYIHTYSLSLILSFFV
jgi:hypothetical protein